MSPLIKYLSKRARVLLVGALLQPLTMAQESGSGAGPSNATSVDPVFLLANSMPNATSSFTFDVTLPQNESSALNERWTWTVNITNVPVSDSQVVTNEVNALTFGGNPPNSNTTCYYLVSGFPPNVTNEAKSVDGGCLGPLGASCTQYLQTALAASNADSSLCNPWPNISPTSPCGTVFDNATISAQVLGGDALEGQAFSYRASAAHATSSSLQADPYYTNATGELRMLVLGTKTSLIEDRAGGLFGFQCMRLNSTIDFDVPGAASRIGSSTAALFVAGLVAYVVSGI